MKGHVEPHLRVRTPADLLWAVRRHWLAALLTSVTVFGLSVVAYLYLPYRYASEAKMLIRVGHEMVRLDPTIMGPTLGVNQPVANQINAEVEILNSQDLHMQVIDEFGTSVFLEDGEFDGEVARYEAARAFAANLQVAAQPDSEVITVRFAHADPATAQRVLDRVVQLHRTKHSEVYQTEGSRLFLETRAAELGKRIADQRMLLHRKQRELGVYSLESRQAVLIAERAARVGELQATTSALASSRAKVEDLVAALEGVDETIVIERSAGHPSPVAEALRTRLAELRLRERELSSEGHRRELPVIADQIRLLAQLLEKEAEEHTIVRTAPNPNRQNLELDLLREKAALAALEARHAEEKAQIARMEEQLDTLEASEASVLTIQNELAVLEAKRRGYLENLEQARMDEALGRERISNISTVQRATLPIRPLGPPRAWFLVVGAILSVFTTLVVVLLGDYYERSFLLPSDVQRSLATDLRAALPRVRGLRMPISRSPDPRKLAKLPADVVSELELLAGRVLGQVGPVPVIGVTSALGGAGVSTVAFHLAAHLATTTAAGTVLVDANVIDGALTRALAVDGSTPHRASQNFALQPTAIPNLRVLPRRGQRLGVPELRMAIQQCREDQAIVVIDLPPIAACAAAVELAKCADSTLFVVDSKKTDVASAQRALGNLIEADAPLLGTVLNGQVVRTAAL